MLVNALSSFNFILAIFKNEATEVWSQGGVASVPVYVLAFGNSFRVLINKLHLSHTSYPSSLFLTAQASINRMLADLQ